MLFWVRSVLLTCSWTVWCIKAALQGLQHRSSPHTPHSFRRDNRLNAQSPFFAAKPPFARSMRGVCVDCASELRTRRFRVKPNGWSGSLRRERTGWWWWWWRRSYMTDLTCDDSLYKPHPARESQQSPLDADADRNNHKTLWIDDARGLSPDVGSVWLIWLVWSDGVVRGGGERCLSHRGSVRGTAVLHRALEL